LINAISAFHSRVGLPAPLGPHPSARTLTRPSVAPQHPPAHFYRMPEHPTTLRALRGATTVPQDTPQQVIDATRQLLSELVARNALEPTQLVSALFSVTDDLVSEFPARAARDLGWDDVPLLCMREIPVPGSLPRCIRVMLHVQLPADHPPLRPVYLGHAANLRPDVG
jgi:chorismate mutase